MPPLERPMAWLRVPLSRPVRDGEPSRLCIDHGVFHFRLIRRHIEYAPEYIGLGPVAEPLERRPPVAELRREVAPWAARPRNPQHRLHGQPVVRAAAPGVHRFAETMRLHLRPFGVSQYKAIHSQRGSQSCRSVNPHSP